MVRYRCYFFVGDFYSIEYKICEPTTNVFPFCWNPIFSRTSHMVSGNMCYHYPLQIAFAKYLCMCFVGTQLFNVNRIFGFPKFHRRQSVLITFDLYVQKPAETPIQEDIKDVEFYVSIAGTSNMFLRTKMSKWREQFRLRMVWYKVEK